VMLV